MSIEQHEELLRLKRLIFNKWVDDPTNKDLTLILDSIDAVLFWREK